MISEAKIKDKVEALLDSGATLVKSPDTFIGKTKKQEPINIGSITIVKETTFSLADEVDDAVAYFFEYNGKCVQEATPELYEWFLALSNNYIEELKKEFAEYFEEEI